MGGDKASAELGDRPLIGYPIAAAQRAGLAPLVVAKRETELPELDVPLIVEPPEPQHPLCGVVAALEAADGAPVLAVACDMPFVTAELLVWLAGIEEPLVVPDPGSGPQPLLARYSPDLADALRGALEGEVPMQEVVSSLGPRKVSAEELARFGDPSRLCFNVNSPEDLAEAERMLGERD